tara:strand:+ start:430 stop:705 length:276 start_codon:yes stop_codon:yes gene_type:complete
MEEIMEIHPTELMLIREGLSRTLKSAARNRDKKKEKVVERFQDRLDDMEREFYAPPKTQNIETPLHKKADVPLPEEDDIVGWVDATEVGCE